MRDQCWTEFSPFWSQFVLKLVESAVIQFGDNFYRLLSSSGKCYNSRTYLFRDWIKPWSWYEMWINIRMEHRKLFSCYQRSLLSADIGHVLTFNNIVMIFWSHCNFTFSIVESVSAILYWDQWAVSRLVRPGSISPPRWQQPGNIWDTNVRCCLTGHSHNTTSGLRKQSWQSSETKSGDSVSALVLSCI